MLSDEDATGMFTPECAYAALVRTHAPIHAPNAYQEACQNRTQGPVTFNNDPLVSERVDGV